MSSELRPEPVSQNYEISDIESLLREAREYLDASLAPNTRRAYAVDLREFRTWCDAHSVNWMPAEATTLVAYLTSLAKTHKVSSITRRLAAISVAHRFSQQKTNPVKDFKVRQLVEGIKRKKKCAPTQKQPTVTLHIKEMVGEIPPTLQGLRDKALLLLGFSGALRRSELVGIDVEDLALCKEGLVVTIRKSKTDQYSHGRKVGVCFGDHEETCPVKAVTAWMRAGGIGDGPLFRAVKWNKVQAGRLSDKAVARMVNRYGADIGLEASQFSGHSLRSGLVTSAIQAGVDPLDVQRHSGHASLDMLKRYIRDATVFRGNPTSKVGL
jgi:site-specific recombinase XerD